jgi:hypothetical protein
MEIEGTVEAAITDLIIVTPGSDSCRHWSPDGTHIKIKDL